MYDKDSINISFVWCTSNNRISINTKLLFTTYFIMNIDNTKIIAPITIVNIISFLLTIIQENNRCFVIQLPDVHKRINNNA